MEGIIFKMMFSSIFIAQITSVPNETFFQVIYWSAKPYIYKGEDGIMQGMIPEVLDLSEYYCGHNFQYDKFIDYAVDTGEMNDHLDLMHSNVSYGEGILKNVSEEKALWLPFMQNIKAADMKRLFKGRNITTRNFFTVKKLVLIVSSSSIHLTQKLWVGVYNCRMLVITVLLASVFFAMLIWVVERTQNKSKTSTFIEGFGIKMWFAITTLSTVGYGDTIPKTILSRFLTALWMIFGMVMASVITAIITDTVTNDSHLQFRGKRIAVINNSMEAAFARRAYGDNIVNTRSNKEAIDLVRNEEAFAAIMNADIAAWHQDDILGGEFPVSYVATVPVQFSVNLWANVNPKTRKWFDCVQERWTEIVDYVYGKHVQEVVTESLINTEEILTKKYSIIVYTGVGCLLLLGLTYDLMRSKCSNCKCKKQNEQVRTENGHVNENISL